MSRDHRKDPRSFYNRDRDWDRDRDRERERERDRDRARDRERDRNDYRSRPPLRMRSRTPPRRDDNDKRRSRSPRKGDKDLLDENILNEISKLPEPSELWDNQPFQEGVGFSSQPPPGFVPLEGAPPGNYPANYQQASYSGIYDDFPTVGGVAQAPLPPDMSAWNQMSLPPPPQQAAPPAPFHNNVEDQIKKEAAIESEMRHQKAALSKQREDYIKKANILKKEMDTLKDQRNELRGDAKRSPSPDTKRFLKENTKLQLEIQNKLKTIYNVVDMLNGIIGEEAHEIVEDGADTVERKRKSRSPSASKKFNYVYYDPEMHWCRVCNEFPPTAKDYLNHLHSPAHHKMAAAHMEAPWHSVSGVNEGFPSFPAAPTKRTPIKGLQFFVPSTAWYCKLCDQFIGDLHCASAHLKSIIHSKNYTNFVEQNPHWETDWMSDRQKAFEKNRATKGKSESEKPAQYMSHTITFNKDGFHTKRKNSPTNTPEDKKKKKDKKKKSKRKSSSSSSSDSSSSDSEPVKKKKSSKNKKLRVKEEAQDEKSITEWMSNIQMDRLNDNDRKLLDTLKSRMKKDKVDDDKRRSPDRLTRDRAAEISRKVRESDRRESRSREDRDRRREERDRDTTPRPDSKKPEIKKMPFIGKMPVYKHLGKNSKTEEQKKDELKKKEEEEVSKKRREEMDAEIQKKVAEFKEKIARAQLERQAQVELGPPPLALPTQLAASHPPPTISYMPPAQPPQPPPTPQIMPPQNPPQPPQPALPKDFQDALDIIFPTDVQPDMSQGDGLFPLPPGFVPGLGGVMPPFPPLPLMQTQMSQMFGFDLNGPLFQPPRQQLYDTHVPLVPSPKPRHQNKNRNNKPKQNQRPKVNSTPPQPPQPPPTAEASGDVARKQEEMDDLAMLGIDASDVGCI